MDRVNIEMMTSRRLKWSMGLMAACLFGAAAFSAPAMAQVDESEDGVKLIDFCSDVEGGKCYTVNIKNASSATVMSTVIDQNSTGGVCSKSSIRVKDSNVGNNSIPNKEIQEYVRATLNSTCAYEVKYNVTKGCTGDTRARVKAGKTPATIGLDKNCGTLKTYKNYG
ncbi:MAG: hypothetical protein AAGH49_12020 [Pseudomonadota bacterium]